MPARRQVAKTNPGIEPSHQLPLSITIFQSRVLRVKHIFFLLATPSHQISASTCFGVCIFSWSPRLSPFLKLPSPREHPCIQTDKGGDEWTKLYPPPYLFWGSGGKHVCASEPRNRLWSFGIKDKWWDALSKEHLFSKDLSKDLSSPLFSTYCVSACVGPFASSASSSSMNSSEPVLFERWL